VTLRTEKSTTIRILLGLLRADSGEVEVLGGDPWRDAVDLHRRMAYVPGDVELWPNLTGGEAIDVLGRLRAAGVRGVRRPWAVRWMTGDPRTSRGRVDLVA
jgi:ABC-2 type transport system ATP-binding protein